MLVLFGFIIICFSAGALGGIFTMSSLGTWYAGLVKPSFNPPNWIFAPVWNTLYLMMAVSGWLVWKKVGWAQGRDAFKSFFGQLALNLLWTVVFFGLQRPEWAFGEIVLLWLAIVVTIVRFWKISPLASILLWPYLVWVTFAAFLNLFIWQLNYNQMF